MYIHVHLYVYTLFMYVHVHLYVYTLFMYVQQMYINYISFSDQLQF
jgi:hypothetical protein